MRVLVSTVGSRGEVQPVAALAVRLRELGQDVRVCVPPDFHDLIDGLGIPVVPLGPRMNSRASGTWDLATPEGRRRAADEAVAAQFAALPEAARGCDVLVGTGPVLVAGRSAAELAGIDYVHAHYCPAALPSPHHAPAPWPGWPQDETGSNRDLWAADARRWAEIWGPALNAQRATAGLPPVQDVRGHVGTDRPWLAADPTLGPWPEPEDPAVIQTGAWILPDERPLPPELESFLAAGAPPVYCGLGSMSAPGDDVSRVLVGAARAVGRRAVISRGWADLPPADDGDDCLVIGEANHQALFRRVAAVVQHGGAGTTTAVARAGVPQVVLPQVFDQHYWAARVDRLGIGVAHPQGMPTTDSLTTALRRALAPDVVARARDLGTAIRTDGTHVAAERLLAR